MNWNDYYIRVTRTSEGEYLDSGTFYVSTNIYDGDLAKTAEDGSTPLSGYSPEGKLFVRERSEQYIRLEWIEPLRKIEFSLSLVDTETPASGMDGSYGGSYRYYNLQFSIIPKSEYKPEKGNIEYFTKQEWSQR